MVGKVLYIKYKEIVDGQIVEKVRYAVDRWQADDKYMGESFITFTVKSPKPIAFSVGDYCEYRGETYTLNYIPSVSQRANIGGSGEAFVYEQVKVDSPREELDRAIMLDVTPTTGDYIAALGTNYTGSAQFQLYCGETTVNGRTLTPVCALAAKMQANLDRAFPGKGWKVLVDTTSTHEEAGQQVLNTHSDEKTLTFDNTIIANALAEVKNTFEIDFAVKGRTIYIGYTFGAITGNDDGDYYYFGYGRGYLSEDNQGKALFELKRTSDSGQKIVTRLRALGSTKNMPYRYYNKKYNLSQSLFPTNLQLPDTFETPEVKAKHNKERKAVYPWIRDVLGDTNDAYIDKNDNCLDTVEGLREDCMRWDGTNADLKEIYPSIEEVTYGELRTALCEDQDGNKGSSAFPHYGDNERVDEILDIDTDTNVGDGILTESDSTRQTASDTEVRFTYNESSDTLLYTGSAYRSPERDVMKISSQYAGNYIISNSHLWFRASYSLGRHQSETITKTCKVAYQIKVYAKDLSTNKESVICTYISDYKQISNREAKEYEVQVAKLPDVDAEVQKVDKITVTNPSDIRITFALLVMDIDYSYDQWNVNWNLGLSFYETPDTDTEWTPSLIWDLEGSASTFMKNPFHVYVKDMGFDFVAAFGTSDTPKIAMKSGMCVAREFTIGNNPQKVEYTKNRITYKAWRLTLAKAEDSSLKTYYPSENFPLAAGDNFVIIGIEMPDVYIQAASMKLLVEATKALAEVCDTKHEYEPSVDDIYIQRNYDRCEEQGDVTKSVYWKLGAGMKFPFYGIAEEGKETPDMFSMIIDTLSIREGEGLTPKISIKLSEDFQQSTLQKLTRTVTSITNGSIFKATSIGSGGGLDESSVRAIVSEFTKRRYLSKLNPDTAAGIITFLQGTNWGNFTSETGAAMTVDPTTGQTYMEVDRLKVRLKAFFEQLEVQKVGYVGGKLIVTKGQGVDILDVEEVFDSEGNLSAYRCYFLGEQEGRKIDNLLRVGDQMICKDCNISEGSTDGATNKYYWRLATAVSSDVVKRGNNVCHWVDLSATDCDTDSDVPSVGDTICHLGNRNDIDRQGAEVLSVVDANSPSFTIYAGINSYSLVDKEHIDMGVSGGKAFCNIYGSTYIGDRERSTGYLRWNDDTKTFEIKGTIDISSPLSSGGTIGGAISSAANAYKDDFSTFTSNVNKVIGEFQDQLDGAIETWFYDDEPTLTNEPAVNWTDNDTKDKHLGDLYYSGEGKAYRFQKNGDSYVWQIITDTDITKALEEAKKANDTANAAQGTADSKMKVFVKQPTDSDEYSIGDMWVNATYPADGSTYNNEILHCVTAKAAGKAFSITHWAQSSNIKTQFNNFVNNTYADDKKDFYNQLDGKVETWYQSADPKDSWATADYSKHTGDIWYNGSTNKAYRWTGTAWVELKDQAAIDAKALAESKRRVFTTTTLPTPPYDARDLWVQGENGDIMVCVTPKAAGTTASASDWVKASKYTDDTAANAAQTTANNAAAAAQGINNAINAIDGNVNVALKDKIITKTEAAAIGEALNSLSAIMADVTKTYEELVNNVVYQLISSDVRTNYNSAYTTLDTAYNELSDYINNTLLKVNPITDNILSTYNSKYSNFKEKYEAYVSKLTVVRNSMDAKLNTRIGDLAAMLGGLKATTDAMDETTKINGGLILSTLLALGYTDSNKVFNVMSGVSGLYESDMKGGGIAFWAGGHRIDIKDCEKNEDGTYTFGGKVVNPADYIVRHDGTGYMAGGNIWWEKGGNIHADPLSFFVGEETVGNILSLFQFIDADKDGKITFGDDSLDYVKPRLMFDHLNVASEGVKIGNIKLHIKNDVLFIDGDLAVTGGITMYASDGVKSGMIDQVFAVLDKSIFSVVNDVITITGEIGSGTVKGITINSTKYDPDANGIIALTLNWGDLTGVPTTFTPSAHTHDDRYYTETEIDALLAGKSNTGHTHDDSYYTEAEIDTKLGLKLDTSLKGTANGLATLDASGKVPSAQLPSYVDDVLEYTNKASFPATGEAGKIYIDQTTNLTYRWGGTAYVEISQSLALGETSSTAYAGDKGKQNAADIAALKTGKADKATTLAGYGITDAYTKTETYTKTEVNTKLTDGSVTKIGTADVGSTTKPIYLKAGVPTEVGTSLAVDITGNSATTSKLKTAVTLWGQSFDGSEAITGNLSNVGTITPTGEDLKVVGNLIVTGGIVMYADDGASIESGFAALLAAHIDGVTIKYNSDEQKIYSVMSGIAVNGTTYKPNETTGIITIPDYPTSLDWSEIENKPSTFAPSAHTHTFASLTSKPTTIAGYGITDAKIVNGVITLGTATITPLTAHQTVTLASGTNNGTLKLTVNGTATDNIAVKGLGSAAYTEASAYAAASHTHSQYLVAASLDGYVNALTDNTSTNVFVTAISKSGKTLSYTKSFTKKSLTAVGNSGWTSAAVDALIIPDMSFIAYWNGAYNSSGNSNLLYCAKGAFGDMATASKSSYYVKGDIDTKLGDGSVTKLGTGTTGAANAPIYWSNGKPAAVTLVDTANNLLNNLTTGTSNPTDADYYIAQYAGGGTTTTTYHRRPHSALYGYIKGKAEGTWGISVTGNAATATTLQTARTLWGQSFNGSANVSGNMSGVGQITFSDLTGTNGRSLLYQKMADNDLFRIYVGGTASNAGYAEIATADDGTEPIYVRQYSGVFSTLKRTLTLLDGSGNTSLPGTLTAPNATISSTLKVGAIPVTNSSTGILKIDGDLIVTGGITMYATDGVASGLMEQILVDGTTIKKKADGTLYADITVIGGGTVKGATVGGTAVTLDSATGILQFPAYPTLSSLGAAAKSHTHSYLPLAGGTLTGTLTTVTTGTGAYNQGIRINRTATNQWATLLIGKSGTATSGTGTTTAGDGAWLIGTPASSNSLIFNLNSASETVGLCLKGHGASDMKWNNNTVLHAGNYSSYALPLSGGTLSGGITFSNTSHLLWNSGSYHQRIFITDDSTADTAVFTFQQSSDSGANWSNLMTIRDNSKVIATTFVGALSGNASTATKLTSSAGSATLPIYFSDGKPVACTAASVFSNLTNSGNNISVTVAGQNRTLTVGYASTSSKVVSRGNLTAYEEGSTTMGESGINLYTVYNNGYPVTYGNLIHIYGSGAGQLLAEWCGSSTLGHLYYRSKRDNTSNGWSAWGKVAFTTDTVANSDTCDGLHVHTGRNNEANKIVRTDGSGYIQCGYINSSSGNEGNNSSPARVWGTNGSDNYMRTYLTSALAVATATKWATARTITLTGSVTGSVSIDGSGNVTLATTTNHTHSYLPLSGGTMTGVITAKANMYEDAYNGALNMANSDIYGLNSIYTADLSDSPGEGIHFYRTSTTVDTFRISNGVMYFAPNRTLGSSTATEYTVMHTGNYSSWASPKTHTHSVTINGSTKTIAATGGTAVDLGSYLPLAGGTMNANARISHADGNMYLGRADNNGWVMCQNICSQNGSGNTYWSLRTDGSCCVKDTIISGTCEVRYQTNGTANGTIVQRVLVYPTNYYGLLTRVYASGAVSLQAQRETTTSECFSLSLNPLGGYVGIGTSSPSQKLHVTGNVQSERILLVSGSDAKVVLNNTDTETYYHYIEFQQNGTAYGSLGTFGSTTLRWTGGDILASGGITMYSDLRKKNVLSDEVLTVKEIALAPLFAHTYKSDENHYLHIGTSAQYWSAIHEGWFTRKDSEGYYQMELQNLGVAMGISLAREIVKYESKTDKKIRLMKKKINDLEARIKELEGSMEERRTA